MNKKVYEAIMEACKKAMGDPKILDEIRKAGIVTTTGLGIANVEQGIRDHVPITETFWRDNIFRRPDAAGSSSAWKVITSYDTLKTLPYVPDGKRAGIATKSPGDASANFGMVGIEDSMTKMAMQQGALLFGGEPQEKAWFRAALNELFSLLEDQALFGANKDFAVAKPTTVAGVAASGGTANQNVWLRVIPLSYDGLKLASLTGGLVKQQAITTGAGETYNINGGCGVVSDALSAYVAASNQKITWTWDPVIGAAGYAIFAGVDAGGEPATSALYLQAITTVNLWVQTADLVTTYQTLAALAVGTTDFSYNSTAWRGILYQGIANKATNGFYYASNDGAVLTMTNGILNELATGIESFYANHGIEPEFIVMDYLKSKEIVALALSSSNPRVALNIPLNASGEMVVGARVVGIVSHITGRTIPVKILPGWPSGWILFGRWNLPSTTNASPKTVALRSFGGAWLIDWTPTTLTDYSGVYEHGGVELYEPFAWGLLQDVG